MTTTLYTIGYEGQDIDAFVQNLSHHGVELLIDVREAPISRKRGFSKNALAAALAKAEIGYALYKAVGCPKPIRDQYRKTKDWAAYTAQYLAHLDGQDEALADLLAEVSRQTCVLMCYEADASQCHRSYVAERLAEMSEHDAQPLIVTHLRFQD